MNKLGPVSRSVRRRNGDGMGSTSQKKNSDDGINYKETKFRIMLRNWCTSNQKEHK